ncbi:MAG: DUF932 domain-containing protein [Bacteroidia bacterium]|nr:DUF932 domain-containing protein [Bacteroidia bacterium]
MAHKLNTTRNKVSFVSTKPAWHGLGQIVKGAITAEQAIELGGLNYEVVKSPLITEVNGQRIGVSDSFATLRTDTNQTLGVVGNRYEIVQNKDAFVFFDAIVGQGQAIFETAGALGKGERIFITAKMPEYIRIAGTDDLTEVYVILTNTHDGSGSVIAAITPIRIVCNNTLRAGLKGAINKIAIKHTTNAERNLCQAHKLLGISNEYIKQMNQAMNALALKKMNDVQVKALIENLFQTQKEDSTRSKNIREAVLESYYTGIGQEKIRGTAWGVFNGVTHYLSHVKDFKNSETKFENLLMDGAVSKITNNALEQLLAI